jgi:beta-galactosidase GanA
VCQRLCSPFLFAAAFAALPQGLPAQSTPDELPRIVDHDGRHALLVDGAPFLIMGVQAHNSSAWPAMMPRVWPAVEALHANTLEIPVYWEQFEPEPGNFDTSSVDMLISQARAHGVRLVLLWFGTWKNGSSHYMPLWMKLNPGLYPRVIGADGRRVDSPSPHSAAALAADCRAFAALMAHLRAVDAVHTVILVQVENETGTWGSVRDFSPEAQKLFEGPVPRKLIDALGASTAAGGNWSAVFGPNADEFFHAWSIASYVGAVAAAGKREYPLPLYVNTALRDPLSPGPASGYESGGPTDNVIPIWKAAAPAVDILAPDIYLKGDERYRRVLELYGRADNPLFVPETRGGPDSARYFFMALGHGAIGWSPFGLDFSDMGASPLGILRVTADTLAPVALNYSLVGPMMREVARLNFEGRLQAVSEPEGEHTQRLDFGRWQAVVTYGALPMTRGKDGVGNPKPVGGALVGKLGEDDFLVTGEFCRVDFKVADPTSTLQRDFLRVEEGSYESGTFKPIRIWNGDETDWGLNFNSEPRILRVLLGTY